VLKLIEKVFTEVKLEVKPENLAPLPAAPIASHETNTIQAAPMLKIVLPALPVTFDEPVSLQLWPMFAEPFAADYATAGLAQGESLWQDDHLTLRDGQPATPPGAQKLPKDLGVGVRGTVKNGAKQVDLYLLDGKGEKLKFRLKPEVNALASDVTTADVKTVDGKGTFAVRLYVDDPQRFFGLVQLVAVTKQGQPDGWGNVTAMLLGVQLGLCDDHLQSAGGDLPGPPIGPGDEENVIDFTTTAVRGPLPTAALNKKSKDPAVKAQINAAKSAAKAALRPFTRARRMVCFHIRADRYRRNSRNPSGATELRPEMPLWMAELQLVGFRAEEAKMFIQMRQAELGIDNRAVVIKASFALKLSWRGPDADLPGPARKDGSARNPFASVSMTFQGTFRGQRPPQPAEGTSAASPASPPKSNFDANAIVIGIIDIEDDGRLKVSDEGASLAEVDPPYAAIPYPVSGRRSPCLWLDQRRRAWGWRTDAAVVPTLVLEWQPPIGTVKRSAFAEIVLGGDGSIELSQLSFADRSVGRSNTAPAASPVASSAPLLALSTFRVKGDNPAQASAVNDIVDAAVEEVVAANSSAGPVQMLSADVWKRLARQLMFHESGGQHFSIGVAAAVFRERTPYQCHGIQLGMPKFGAPAGYGLGQHDPPTSLQDMWSFYEHIRGGIEKLIVGAYGGGAYTYLSSLNALDTGSSLDKAILLREAVRRYNGGREFVYEQNRWKMKPSVPTDRRPYVNSVLGTTVHYPHDVVTGDDIADLAGATFSPLL
jgi:hypothetical protein